MCWAKGMQAAYKFAWRLSGICPYALFEHGRLTSENFENVIIGLPELCVGLLFSHLGWIILQ